MRTNVSHLLVCLLALATAQSATARSATAQSATAQSSALSEQRAAIAAADSLLDALSRSDTAGIRRFTADSAILGFSAIRQGAERVRVHSWAEVIATPNTGTLVERGFNATARVQDRLAHVWMPYDIYINGAWSHCGVDAFTLIKVAGAWKTVALFYTVEQPPACTPHPVGPPRP